MDGLRGTQVPPAPVRGATPERPPAQPGAPGASPAVSPEQDHYSGSVEPTGLPDARAMREAVHGSPTSSEEHGHGTGEKVQHGLHQGKVGVHGLHEGAEAVSEVRHGPRPGHAQALTSATESLNRYDGLQKAATRASHDQSSVARRLNRALGSGKATPDEINALRQQLVDSTKAANTAHQEAQKAREAAEQARKTIQTLQKEAGQAGRSSPLMRRAMDALGRTTAGEKVAQVARTAAESRFGEAANALAHSKIVKVAGRALVVGAVAADTLLATREGATLAGNATRGVGQAAASTALYTQPHLLPVLAAEAFLMDRPHVTGPIQSAVQTVGVVTDYVSGGSEAGDKALANLDQEMKDGKYGGVIKGANYLGQEFADKGAGGVASQTVDYWSQASPGKTWEDVKSIASWLFGGGD